jgi:hypothetical protein
MNLGVAVQTDHFHVGPIQIATMASEMFGYTNFSLPGLKESLYY